MPSARNPQLAPLPPPAHGEPFRLGGLQDPVAWYEVEEEKEEVFQSLLTYGCGYTESRTSTVADPSGLRTDQLFYAVHGGPIRRGAQVTLKSLPFIGWVSQAQIYVILSTGTEVQLVHELQNSLDIARRDGDEIARAWYAFRLREAVLSDIPAENRAAAGPITVSPNCHALTCWLARAASGSDHWSEARRDWMDLHASVDTLDMWESLAGCSDFLHAMRTAQDDIFGGPWFGTMMTNGLVPLNLPVDAWNQALLAEGGTLDVAFTALRQAHDIVELVDICDTRCRPHWSEAMSIPADELADFEWPEGYLPAPKSLKDNQSRFRSPNASEWYKKLKPLPPASSPAKKVARTQAPSPLVIHDHSHLIGDLSDMSPLTDPDEPSIEENEEKIIKADNERGDGSLTRPEGTMTGNQGLRDAFDVACQDLHVTGRENKTLKKRITELEESSLKELNQVSDHLVLVVNAAHEFKAQLAEALSNNARLLAEIDTLQLRLLDQGDKTREKVQMDRMQNEIDQLKATNEMLLKGALPSADRKPEDGEHIASTEYESISANVASGSGTVDGSLSAKVFNWPSTAVIRENQTTFPETEPRVPPPSHAPMTDGMSQGKKRVMAVFENYSDADANAWVDQPLPKRMRALQDEGHFRSSHSRTSSGDSTPHDTASQLSSRAGSSVPDNVTRSLSRADVNQPGTISRSSSGGLPDMIESMTFDDPADDPPMQPPSTAVNPTISSERVIANLPGRSELMESRGAQPLPETMSRSTSSRSLDITIEPSKAIPPKLAPSSKQPVRTKKAAATKGAPKTDKEKPVPFLVFSPSGMATLRESKARKPSSQLAKVPQAGPSTLTDSRAICKLSKSDAEAMQSYYLILDPQTKPKDTKETQEVARRLISTIINCFPPGVSTATDDESLPVLDTELDRKALSKLFNDGAPFRKHDGTPAGLGDCKRSDMKIFRLFVHLLAYNILKKT